jgi:hypothetical protein
MVSRCGVGWLPDGLHADRKKRLVDMCEDEYGYQIVVCGSKRRHMVGVCEDEEGCKIVSCGSNRRVWRNCGFFRSCQ